MPLSTGKSFTYSHINDHQFIRTDVVACSCRRTPIPSGRRPVASHAATVEHVPTGASYISYATWDAPNASYPHNTQTCQARKRDQYFQMVCEARAPAPTRRDVCNRRQSNMGDIHKRTMKETTLTEGDLVCLHPPATPPMSMTHHRTSLRLPFSPGWSTRTAMFGKY